MRAGEIGYVIGGFVTAMLLPVLILIVSNFIPPTKRNPSILYGICGILAIGVPFLALNGGASALDSVIAAALAGALTWWGYTRAAKKKAQLPKSQELT
jgi:hypothetical protein